MDAEALRKEITEKVELDFEAQVRELRRQKNDAEEELDSAAERWRAERRKLKAEIEQLEERVASPGSGNPDAPDRDEARELLASQIAQLETSLAESAARLDQLPRDYEVKIEALTQENERLSQQLEAGSFAAAEVLPAPVLDSGLIEAEMQRAEGMIRAIATLLEHPDTTASMMARKNVERAETEAYLRGLNFQLAPSKGS